MNLTGILKKLNTHKEIIGMLFTVIAGIWVVYIYFNPAPSASNATPSSTTPLQANCQGENCNAANNVKCIGEKCNAIGVVNGDLNNTN